MDQEPGAQSLRLPFNRPEYFSVPELLISSLAHKAYARVSSAEPIGRGAGTEPSGKPEGYMYLAEPREKSGVDVRSTFPKGPALGELNIALQAKGLHSEAHGVVLADGVARSVLGIRLDATGYQPASPLTPALALMQDARGVLVKSGPPDFAEILESMFAVGAPSREASAEASVTGRWLKAADTRIEIDPLLQAIDAAMADAVLKNGYRRNAAAPWSRADKNVWSGNFLGTPYAWFHRAWTTLTADEWVDALPARVWVDWATTILRLSMGIGFLWEAAWYENLARVVIERSVPQTFRELVTSVDEALPWRSSRAAVASRDVASHIKHSISRGEKARKYLGDLIDSYADNGLDLTQISAIEFLSQVAREPVAREDLSRALNSATIAGKAVHETAKYGLQVRRSSGEFTDHYGILRPHGRRWVLVDPGTEWISVVASLSCSGPGRSCTVGDVLTDLTTLGMRPEIGDLVELLERAGLARGSADADNAVVVESAF